MIAALKKISLCLVGCGLLSTAYGSKSQATPFSDQPGLAVEAVLRGISVCDATALWQSLPVSYQADINELAQLMGHQLDADIYAQIVALIGQLGSLIQQQQHFIFGSEKLAASIQNTSALKSSIPAFVGIIELFVDSSFGSVDRLKQFQGQSFFATTISGVICHAQGFSDWIKLPDFTVASLSQAQVTVVSQDATHAELELKLAGQTADFLQLVKVEGRWVLLEVAEQWAAKMAELQVKFAVSAAESIALQKPQLMGLLAMLDGVLAQLAAAETQQQFDQAVRGAMMPLLGLMMLGQQWQ